MSNSIFVSFKKHNLICSPQDTCSPHSDPVLEAPGPVAGLSPHHQGHRAGSDDTESPEKETETKLMLPESSFCVTTNLTKIMSDELLTDLETVNL